MVGGVVVGLLIALFVFLAVQGAMLDLSFLILAVFVAAGFILQARQKRRGRRVQREADEVLRTCQF